jgi:hypothetical protein
LPDPAINRESGKQRAVMLLKYGSHAGNKTRRPIAISMLLAGLCNKLAGID